MKTKLPFFIVFSFLGTLASFSQAPAIEWQNTIGGIATDELWSMDPTSDGGYILGGTSSSGATKDKTEAAIGSWDYWVVKINSIGNIEWQETLGGSDQDHLRVVKQTADGGYIIGGYSISNASADKSENKINSSYDYWVVKLDSDGGIEWDNTIGGLNLEYLYAIELTTDGGYLLGGYSTSGIGADKTETNYNGFGYGDYWIVKLDPSGTIEWDETIGGADDDILSSVVLTTDGGYILCGTSLSDASFDKSDNTLNDSFQDDYWIVKIDSEATIEWDITIGGAGWDYGIAIQQTPDNGYIVGGSSSSNSSPFKSENRLGGGVTVFDVWIVKLDEDGNIMWENTIGGNNQDYLSCLDQTLDGGYVLGIRSESPISFDKTENLIGAIDYWIVKLDADGNITWDNTIGGSGYDQVRALHTTPDGGYALAGGSNSIVSGDKSGYDGDYDYWIVKLESDLVCMPPAGIFADNITSTSAKIHWNPVPGATKYLITYRPVTGGPWLKKNSPTTVKTLNALTPNTIYQYKLKTLCDAEQSSYSPVYHFTTLPLKEGVEMPQFVVYPNPNPGVFTLTGCEENSMIEIYNTSTQLIKTVVTNSTNQIIDISGSAEGIYFLKIHNGNEIDIRKIIVSQ